MTRQRRAASAPSPGSGNRTRRQSRRLNAAAWVDAALGAIAESGIANVSVERLARQLGATKGSFYWHFKDRAALIEAALDEWERRYTDEVIASLGGIGDPRERLRALLEISFEDHLAVRLDANLVAETDDPMVGAAWERVAKKRLAYIDRIFAELGVEGGPDRALLAYSSYLGLAQLRRTVPSALPGGRRQATYIERVVVWLLGDR